MAQQQQAQAGPAVDLRDDGAVRSALFHMLVDWDGTDLKNVYEPISQQFGYLFTFFLLVLIVGIAWRVIKKWNRERKERPTPYRVIKPPSSVVAEGEGEKKQIFAVLGGTGFVGSHVVEELLSRGNCHVYLLGRQFKNVSEEVRSQVDALIQVDLMDGEGLANAFRGVDTVIHAAAAIPNVFTSTDTAWRVNKLGADMVIAAAQESGVKQLVFVSGVQFKNKPSSTEVTTLLNCFMLIEQAVIAANGKEGLATCVLAFGQIYGLREHYNMFLKGQMSSFPLLDMRATFQPVEYTAKVILAAADKLAQRSDQVAGKILKVGGWPATFKEFFTLPEWGHKPPRNMSISLLTLFARLNVLVAMVTGWAPMGKDLTPIIAAFFEVEEEEVDNSIMEEALGVDGPPDIREGVRNLAEKFKRKEENKKLK